MSYSFSKKAATKAELETAVMEEFDKVPVSQPVHEVDIKQAKDAAKSLIDLMTDDPQRDMYCSVSGSIWKNDDGVRNVTITISLSMSNRQ